MKTTKQMFRDMVKKYHTDGTNPDEEIIRKINDAKTDKTIKDLYKELMEKPLPPKPEKKKLEPAKPVKVYGGKSFMDKVKNSKKQSFRDILKNQKVSKRG